MNFKTACYILLALSASAMSLTAPRAQAAADPELTFHPIQSWDFNASAGQQCKIQTVFNNGFAIDFETRGGQVNAMNIDFRQDAFESGQNYDVFLNVPGLDTRPFAAQAPTGNMLHINLQGQDEFFHAIRHTATMDLTFQDSTVRFYVMGLAEEGQDLTACKPAMKSVAKAPIALPPQSREEAEAQAVSALEPSATEPVMPKEPPVTIRKKTAEPVVNKEVIAFEGDFTDYGAKAEQKDMPVMAEIEAEIKKDGPLNERISTLETMLSQLKKENQLLNEELKRSLAESREEKTTISSENWNLERATMRFNEAERQLAKMGSQLQRERAQCSAEKQELEAMLFDPQLTNQQQLARLATLEDELSMARTKLEDQRRQYEERIQILQQQASVQ